MSPACLRISARYSTSVGVAGVEADAHARPGSSAWTASARPAPRRCRAARRSCGAPVPGELGVALVGEHGHRRAPGPTPPPRPGRSARPVGLDGLFTHRHSARSASSSATADRSRPPSARGGHLHQPAAGQARPHGVGRVGQRRGQHGVAPGRAQLQEPRRGGHELLGADARRDLRRRRPTRRSAGASSRAAAPRSAALPIDAG